MIGGFGMSKAIFIEREACITCGAENLITLSKGRFTDNPLNGFLANDPWGKSPLPYIDEESWLFVQCANCSQKFHKKILNDDWLNIYYSEWISADAIDAYNLENPDKISIFNKAKANVEHVLQIEKSTRTLRGGSSVKILDFGCGDGDFLSCCSMFGFECHGVEFSEARYQRRNIDFHPSLESLLDDQNEKLEFDVITMFEVLEHLAEPLQLLTSLTKLLKKGGVFIMETPDCTTVNDIKTMHDYRHIHPLGHINAFTADTMKKIANNVGLEFFRPGTPQVTADYRRALKREARRIVGRFKAPSTQMYFVKA